MILVIPVAKLVMELVKQIAYSVRQIWQYNFLKISLESSIVLILVMMDIQEYKIIVCYVILAAMAAMELINKIVFSARAIF